MKPTLHTLLLFLLFTLSCNKYYQAEYTLNCQFSVIGLDGRLVVVDYKGNTLETFNIPNGMTSFSEKVITTDPGSPDSFDLYIIYPDPTTTAPLGYSVIFGQLGVKNGSQVFLNPSPPVNSDVSDLVNIIRIQDLSSIDEFEVPRYPSNIIETSHSAPNALLQAIFVRKKGQGMVILALANGEPTLKEIYLPDSLLNDSINIELSWNDFKPKDSYKEVKMPQGITFNHLDVSAVSEDFKSFAKIWPPSSNAQPTGFNLPQGLPASFQFAIRAEADNLILEKVFKPEGPFEFKEPDIDILSWDNLKTLNIQTKGPVDLITLEGNKGTLYCKISGKPGDFNQKKLPDLSPWVSDWTGASPLFSEGTIHAYSFDLYDYEQAQAGFPFQLNEQFAFARSGYSDIWKQY